MSFSDSDQGFMRAALREAKIAESTGEVPVGAVVVRNGEIIGSGLNRSIQDADPTAHAEIIALREAARSEHNYRLPGTTLFVTLEPCAMCAGALLQARIARLVFAAYDEKAGAAGSVVDLCDHRKLNHRIEVQGGLLEENSVRLLTRFFAARRYS